MIKIPLKPKSYWEANQLVGVDEIFPGKARMIQGLKEIGPMIEAEVQKSKVDKLDYSLPLIQFFPKFLELLKELRTPMRGFEIKYDGHYFINIHCFFDYKNQCLYYMPLSFLPLLKKKNKKLHDIIVETIKLLYFKGVSIIDEPFYDDDDWLIESMSEYCAVDTRNNKNEPDYEKELATRELALFIKHKENYVNKVFSSSGDLEKLNALKKAYKSQTNLEKKVLEWTDMVIDAYHEPNGLDDFDAYATELFAKYKECDVEDAFDDGYPVSITQCMRFTWFGNETYTEMATQNLGEIGGNFGELEFSHEYACRSAKDIRNARNKFVTDWGFFPEKLSKLLEIGVDIVPDIWNYIDNKLTVILYNDGI